MDTKLAVFDGKQIRRKWDERKEKWYFSVVDIITVLINQPDHKKAQSYRTTLKNRLKEEGSEVVTKCDRLKMQASDGKFYKTDAELVFTALAELSTRQIAETMKTRGLEKNKIPAKKGGRIAKNARLELEQRTGKKIITQENYLLGNKTRKLTGKNV